MSQTKRWDSKNKFIQTWGEFELFVQICATLHRTELLRLHKYYNCLIVSMTWKPMKSTCFITIVTRSYFPKLHMLSFNWKSFSVILLWKFFMYIYLISISLSISLYLSLYIYIHTYKFNSKWHSHCHSQTTPSSDWR